MTSASPKESGTRGALLRAFYEVRKSKFAKCIGFPGCQEPAIRAHSVQNSRVLDLLVDADHVLSPAVEFDKDSGPRILLDRVGRNSATTFTGLCSTHDSEFFRPIDYEVLDPTSLEHRSLLAWRASLFESHATMAVAAQMQQMYHERVKLGLDSKDSPSPAGLFAVHQMHEAWKVFRWRADLDIARLEGRPLPLLHESLVLDVAEPTVAASALFVVGLRKNPNDFRCVTLNVLPISPTKTWALFSFKARDRREVLKVIRRVIDAPAHNIKYQLSRLILQRSQNFVLAPRFVQSWPESRMATVLHFFERTMVETEIGFDSPDLQLLT